MGDDKDQKQANPNTKGPNTKEPVTIISRPFVLKYLEAQYLPPYDGEVGDMDTSHSKLEYRDGQNVVVEVPTRSINLVSKPVTSRWVYVFQRLGDKIVWFGEYWYDAQGNYHLLDIEAFRSKERHSRPEPPEKGTKLLVLPHTINGKRAFYTFFVSGTRLALASIHKLETEEYWNLLSGVDLKEDKSFFPEPLNLDQPNDSQTPQTGTGPITYVPVVDHLKYGSSLNRVMQQLRDRAVSWVSTAKDITDATQIARIEKRQKKKLLAEILDAVLRGDSDHSLAKRLVENGTQKVYDYIRDYEAKLNQKLKDVDVVARDLATWMDSKIITFLISTYMILEDVDIVPFQLTDFPAFLVEYAQCTDRLSETGPGKVFLSRVQKDNSHFSHQFLAGDPPSGPKIQAWRKAYTAGFSLWKELVMVALEERDNKAVEHMVDALNNAGHMPFLKIEFQQGNFLFRREEGFMKERPRRYSSLTIEEHGRSWASAEKFTGLLTHVMAFVEAYNLGLALMDLQQASGTEDKIWGTIGALGSAMDAVPAFNVLLRLEEMTVKKISFVSAIIDTVTSLRDANANRNRGDYSAAVGYGSVGAGSALVALGCASAIVGGETVWAGVGLVLEVVGTVLVAAGWLIAWLTKDSDMQIFMAHCVWGERYGQDSGSESWSEGAYEGWHEDKPNGLDHQITAVLNLAAGFTLQRGWGGSGYTSVRVGVGMTMPQSKLYIKFDTQYNKILHQPIYIVDIANRVLTVDTQHNSDPADLSPNRLGVMKTSSGGIAVEVEAHFALNDPAYADVMQIQSCDCEARLDLYGDGTHWIPSSGAWVPYHIKAIGEIANNNFVNSTQY